MRIIRPIDVIDTGSFTRASAARYFDSLGVIQSATTDTPRFGYNPANLAAGPTLLQEAAATNLLLRSQTFDNAAWAKTHATATAASTSAPDGTTTGELLAEDNTTNVHTVDQAAGSQAAGTYTFSFYAKASTRSQILAQQTATTTYGGVFDLVALTFTPTAGGATGTLTAIAVTGWYLCAMTFTTVATITLDMSLGLYNGAASYAGDGVSGLYIWGSQLETGSVATSYIVTTSATVARAADVNTEMFVSNVPETDYALYNAGTTYALGDFVLSLTAPTAHNIYQSAAASNTGNALTNTAKWTLVSSDNRWKLFDNVVSNQSTQATSICAAITPVNSVLERFDSVAGFNCSATSVTVNMVDPTYGNVYSNTVSMVSTSGITDWFAYYFEPIVFLVDFVVEDMPITYPHSTVTVCFSAPSGTAECGELVLGLSKELGFTEYGSTFSITDYSVKTQDVFGNYNIVPRSFSKRAEFYIQVPNTSVDFFQNLLATYRNTPVVYVGSNSTDSIAGSSTPQQFQVAAIYGFWKDFTTTIAYPLYSQCDLQIEGLN
jgi:hypothetical protein